MLTFRAAASLDSLGWVAIGFSDYGALAGADLCAVWRDWRGGTHMADVHTDGATAVCTVDTVDILNIVDTADTEDTTDSVDTVECRYCHHCRYRRYCIMVDTVDTIHTTAVVRFWWTRSRTANISGSGAGGWRPRLAARGWSGAGPGRPAPVTRQEAECCPRTQTSKIGRL